MATNASEYNYAWWLYEFGYPSQPWSTGTHSLAALTLGVGINGPVALFGLVSNTVNVIIFYRQGILSHSSIVSLTALAVSDLLMCLFSAWRSVCIMFLYGGIAKPTWKWDVYSFQIDTASRPMNCVTSFTCFITAFATLERLISVAFPFKVKAIFSPKKSIIIISSFFVLLFISELPNLLQVIYVWGWNPTYNITWLTYQFSNFFSRKTSLVLVPLRLTLRITCIATVAVSNMIIAWKVRMSQRFRNRNQRAANPVHQPNTTASSTSSSSHSALDNNSQQTADQSIKTTTTTTTKEMKLVRMVTAVATVFFICYVGDIPATVCLTLVWRVNQHYHYYINDVVYMTNYFLQTLNSSVNAIIYLTISSSYRQEFYRLFKVKQRGKQK